MYPLWWKQQIQTKVLFVCCFQKSKGSFTHATRERDSCCTTRFLGKNRVVQQEIWDRKIPIFLLRRSAICLATVFKTEKLMNIYIYVHSTIMYKNHKVLKTKEIFT